MMIFDKIFESQILVVKHKLGFIRKMHLSKSKIWEKPPVLTRVCLSAIFEKMTLVVKCNFLLRVRHKKTIASKYSMRFSRTKIRRKIDFYPVWNIKIKIIFSLLICSIWDDFIIYINSITKYKKIILHIFIAAHKNWSNLFLLWNKYFVSFLPAKIVYNQKI